MSLNYDKIVKKSESGDSMWSSYSDLFMILSMVFLLLYVTASLRTGTFSIQKHQEYQKLVTELQDLKEQNRVYNTLKDDYLSNRAENNEQKVYNELMDQLNLLQDEANIEKEALKQQATELDKKEKALNHYQRIVRNIINANVLAKEGLQKRDKVIKKKQNVIETQIQEITDKTKQIVQNEKVISDKTKELKLKQKIIKQKKSLLSRKTKEIENLNQEIDSKKRTIVKNNRKIKRINRELDKKIDSLKATNMSRSQLKKEIAKIKEESTDQIKDLKTQNNDITSELNYSRAQISNANQQLTKAQKTIDTVKSQKKNLAKELRETEQQFAVQSKQMQAEFDAEMSKKVAAMQADIDKQKLSAAEKRKAQKALKREIAKQKGEFKNKINNLKNQISDSEAQRKKAEEKADQFQDYLSSLKKENESLEEDVAKLRPLVKARQELAKKLKRNLKKVGLESAVDEKTGDVVLTFGDEYFATDSSNLKSNMKRILKQFVPTYSSSLLADEKIADKISSVEIIGFASPTYRGKYIDPQSLSPEDRQAVRYNLDLSYKRAKSIFDYIFDTGKMKYRQQKNLLPLVKVTGRSFLSKGIEGKTLDAGMSRRAYCKKFNCAKEQRVIIKFNLSN
ncbi:MAG: hypothetical protein AB8G05_27880 [Oligoflexales bacterium]